MNAFTLPVRARLGLFAALALAMAATRFHHFLSIPDASWAVFFAGGFYLAGSSRWAFPLLMAQAAAIDWIATQKMGVSSYCMTPAYAFLVPTHAALWFGGIWLRRRASMQLRTLLPFAMSVLVAVSLAYLISNTSFYWLGGRVAETSIAHFLTRSLVYYPHFLSVTAFYLAAIGCVHLAVLRVLMRDDAAKS